MVERKESTPERISKRKYEASHREERRKTSGNFQTMIPRELFDEINVFLREKNMTKVEFIKQAFEYLQSKK
ncbi:MAG: hypothetical protein IKB98_02045 [Clostridia bacterium]|nr:hypothetical protein [Clostridiales bacterium]MBR2870150.1 hypothetical protein [Clostridia bacterium]